MVGFSRLRMIDVSKEFVDLRFLSVLFLCVFDIHPVCANRFLVELCKFE